MAKQRKRSLSEKAVAGLLLCGTLTGRRRRKVTMKDKSTRYCITLTVNTGDSVLRCDMWSAMPVPDDLPVVGSEVSVPVGVRVFQSAVGAQYRLTVAGDDEGEDF